MRRRKPSGCQCKTEVQYSMIACANCRTVNRSQIVHSIIVSDEV